MLEISRSGIKKVPEFKELMKRLLNRHQIPEHTINTLYKNRHVKDFCEESRYFVLIDLGDEKMFLHYDMSNWLKKTRIMSRMERIVMYDDFQEYEKARITQLNGAATGFNPSLN